MFKRIDQSRFFNNLLQRLSTLLARLRGLPTFVGIILIAISFVLQIVQVYSPPSQLLNLMAVILQNAGILIALIGLLLAEPLGK